MQKSNNIIFSFIFTLFWALFIIWNRFIRVRLPRDVLPVNPITWYVILLGVLAGISLFFAFYYFLKLIKVIPRPNSKIRPQIEKILIYLESKTWITIITQFIYYNIAIGPKRAYDYLYEKSYIDVRSFLDSLGSILYENNFFIIAKVRYVYIILWVLPSVIPWIILFVEVIVYKHISMFYKTAVLFVVPLICDIILYMMRHYCLGNMDFYQKYFDIEYNKNTYTVTCYLKKLDDTESKEIQKELRDDIAKLFMARFLDYQFVYNIDLYMEKHKLSLTVIKYSLSGISFLLYFLMLCGIIDPYDHLDVSSAIFSDLPQDTPIISEYKGDTLEKSNDSIKQQSIKHHETK